MLAAVASSQSRFAERKCIFLSDPSSLQAGCVIKLKYGRHSLN